MTWVMYHEDNNELIWKTSQRRDNFIDFYNRGDLCDQRDILKTVPAPMAYLIPYAHAERHIKLEVLNFYRRMEPDVFLDWLTSCDNFFA